MLLAERAGRKLEPWSNSRPRGMAVIVGQPAVTESGLSACFIFFYTADGFACVKTKIQRLVHNEPLDFLLSAPGAD